MKAIVRDRYGDTEVLRLDDVPRPVPGDHDVVVRVAIAGLDRGAWHWMTGLPYLSRAVFGLRRPKNLILGTEVAGTVEAVGPAVTTFSVGEEVFGFGRGAFAEYALVADDRLAHKPSGLSFEQAATLPVSGVTALQAVHDHGRVQESPARPRHGCLGRCRQLRRPARQGRGRTRHRSVQPRQGRFRAVPRGG